LTNIGGGGLMKVLGSVLLVLVWWQLGIFSTVVVSNKSSGACKHFESVSATKIFFLWFVNIVFLLGFGVDG